MGFVSLSEDVLKRHESDVHDLLRALEASEVSEASQHRALPGFAQLVAQLEALLNDPQQPFVVRMLHLRAAERDLAAEIDILKQKNSDLGIKNSDLNDRIRRADRDVGKLRDELTSVRASLKRLQAETASKDVVIEAKDQAIRTLESMAMSAQIDRRLGR